MRILSNITSSIVEQFQNSQNFTIKYSGNSYNVVNNQVYPADRVETDESAPEKQNFNEMFREIFESISNGSFDSRIQMNTNNIEATRVFIYKPIELENSASQPVEILRYSRLGENILSCAGTSDQSGMLSSIQCTGPEKFEKLNLNLSYKVGYDLKVTPESAEGSFCKELKDRNFDAAYVYKQCDFAVNQEVEDQFVRYLNNDENADPTFINDGISFQNKCLIAKYGILASGFGGAIYTGYKAFQHAYNAKVALNALQMRKHNEEYTKFLKWYGLALVSLVGSISLQAFIPGKMI